MLDKKVFNAGVDKLLIEYGDKGFKMTKERAEMWYDRMKNMSDAEFKKKIERCLMTCNKVPFLADVADFKQIDTYTRANDGAYDYV
jgi:hypothetical protein